MAQLPDDVQAEIVAAHESGTPIHEIKKVFGVRRNTVHAVLRRAGIVPDPQATGRPARVFTQAELDRMAELRRADATVTAIAAAMGSNEHRIRKELRDLGFDTSVRTPNGPAPTELAERAERGALNAVERAQMQALMKER